jgi:hypothetical protein
VLSVPIEVLPTKNSTPVTDPPASAAVAAMLTVLPVMNPVPVAGDVMLTVGSTLGAPKVPERLGITISAPVGSLVT